MDSSETILDEVLELVRELPQSKRREQLPRVKRIATLLGKDAEQLNYVAANVARWPDRLGANNTELRYLVDFDHGDRPDPRPYLATFNEVTRLLRYTDASCKVAFNSSQNHLVDRTRRPTRLGPCVVTKLSSPVPSDRIGNAGRLDEREAMLRSTGAAKHAKGNKY